MNTPIQYKTSQMLLACLLAVSTAPAIAGDDFQEKMLLSPSQSMLKAESRGHIMIYDGLDSRLVDRAMDEQFDRIDNMMFVHTVQSLADGGEVVEDDGC